MGVVVTAVTHATIGGGISPPTPMLGMCSHRLGRHHVLGGDHVGRLAVHDDHQESDRRRVDDAGGLLLVNYALFRVLFDYGFMQGAPVYVAAQDPHGWFPGVARARVLPVVSVGDVPDRQFRSVAADELPGVMRQPRLGAVWTLSASSSEEARFSSGVILMGTDVVAFMVRVPVPFIFGSIVVLNMLQGSLFAKHRSR